MGSAKRRHQSEEWMILSHVSCFIEGEVVGSQVLLDIPHPRAGSTMLLLGRAMVCSHRLCLALFGRNLRRKF